MFTCLKILVKCFLFSNEFEPQAMYRPTFNWLHIFDTVLYFFLSMVKCCNQKRKKIGITFGCLLEVCLLIFCSLHYVSSEIRSRGAAARSVAPLCQIMSPLLKMASLTSETDSKTTSSRPCRHLSLSGLLAHTELLASVALLDSFTSSH